MDNIAKFSPEHFQNKQFVEKKYREFEIYSKKIRIQFIKPLMTLIRFENKNEVSKSCEIENELENELVTSLENGTAENFNRLLNSCLERMHTPPNVSFSSPVKKTSSTIDKDKLIELKECDNGKEETLKFLSRNFISPRNKDKKITSFHSHNRHLSQPTIKFNKYIRKKQNK